MKIYWNVVIDCPIDTVFTYSDSNLTEEEKTKIQRGIIVEVPFGRGKKNTTGVILGKSESQIESLFQFEIKSIAAISIDMPPIPESYLLWIEWLSQYYLYPLGQILSFTIPPLLKKAEKKKLIKSKNIISSAPPQLTVEQAKVVRDVLTYPNFGVHLVFGVTGSGKTEIYMRVLHEILLKGKSGLVIVPEISLTPQLISRFNDRFGDAVAVIHSHLTPREKTNQWWAMVDQKKSILIGARSALFCPIPNLGIIVVDEEHEPSFKQEEALRYHARDAAIVLAKNNNCPILLGSATPSLESWNNALNGRYHLHRLNSRVENRALPNVEIVDLKKEKLLRKDAKNPSWMTEILYSEMIAVLNRGQQVVLFLNRRGFANVVQCPECAFIVECPNCDISLTLHGRNHLVCHYCDYQMNLSSVCTNCNQGEWKPLGLGTEQIEDELKKMFPQYVIARADRDEIKNRKDMETLIEDMETGRIQILIGTQMIAKGLDFPNLTLVGLLLADVGLHMPDFRSSERGFQLITQVSGRAGRHVKPGEEPGKVIIQTYSPEHISVVKACIADYESFAEQELQARKELNYPPFGKLLSFRISGSVQKDTLDQAIQLKKRAQLLKEKYNNYSDIIIMGPSEAPLARLKNQYRFQLLLKGPKSINLNSFVKQLMGDKKWIAPKVHITIDVDPMNML